jgi:son of sevenless
MLQHMTANMQHASQSPATSPATSNFDESAMLTSTSSTSRSSSDGNSLRRISSLLSHRPYSSHSASQTSLSSVSLHSIQSPSSAKSDTAPSPSMNVRAPIRQSTTPLPNSSDRLDSGAKGHSGSGLLRIGSLSRLRSRNRPTSAHSEPSSRTTAGEPSSSEPSSSRPNKLYKQRISTSSTALPPPTASEDTRYLTSSAVSHSLDIALHDTMPILHTAPDGSVEAGTFEALVRRLFTDTKRTQEDVAYRYTFLASYRIFSSSEHLFNTLKAQYKAVDESSAGAQPIDLATKRYS